MSKFKKGDKVVCVNSRDKYMIEQGSTYTIMSADINGYVRLREVGDTIAYLSSRFELVDEHKALSDAIDLLSRHKVVITGERGSIYDDPIFQYTRLGEGCCSYRKKDVFLEDLFPTETPQQKKLKELEKQQLEIAAQIGEIRNSM